MYMLMYIHMLYGIGIDDDNTDNVNNKIDRRLN